MTISRRVRSALALAIATTIGGCAVGTAYVSAPDRLPSKTLPVLTRPISFDVCGRPDPLTGRPYLTTERRAALGHSMQTLLSQAGVPAALTAVRGSPVDFTVTFSEDFGAAWSAVLSSMTFGVLPGYLSERKTLDLDLALPDGAQGGETEHLRYEARTHRFLWLPLVLSADFLWPGGWESARSRNAGFNQMVERLADDIRARRGGAGSEAARPVTARLACPLAGPPPWLGTGAAPSLGSGPR